MDVIEHVDNPREFLAVLNKATKSGGLVMVSTIAKNPLTWFTHIVLAEYVAKVVPKNTHHYEKFINPNDLQEMLLSLGIQVVSRR
jgi:ubiquinone biosynthesis O-methyltransferase